VRTLFIAEHVCKNGAVSVHRLTISNTRQRALAMETTVRLLTMLAALAVFLVLLAGLWNMMRGTSPNLSQKLMRWRVGLQFLAIVIGMLLVYFWRT
jgi:Mg2+ and Co2+ transporter CorA